MRDGALALGQQGLFLAILKEQEDPLLQDGTIVHQLPTPGQQSHFQKPVYVTVIKKSDAKKNSCFLWS
jgi:beta-lactam-binding protein with PASTA domain